MSNIGYNVYYFWRKSKNNVLIISEDFQQVKTNTIIFDIVALESD